jgi:undecaprenyl-diphosphatase
MTFWNVIILGVVQGLAELLPVSSSAHVVVAEKLLGLDPSSPPMTLLLVMLHTGTMFAVIVYFWKQWMNTYFKSMAAFKSIAVKVIVATVLTVALGGIIVKVIEHLVLGRADIENLFSHLEFIAPALAVAGVLILWAGLREKRDMPQAQVGLNARVGAAADQLTLPRAGIIGMVQGLCVPFRGLSRSGATISAGMLLGVPKIQAEAFSFALAVVLTPPVVGREVLRLVHAAHESGPGELTSVAGLSAFGALVAFIAGLAALKWLSRWLESGRWYLFGIYCLVAAAVVMLLYSRGY